LAAADAPGVLQRALVEDAIDLSTPTATSRVRVHLVEGSGALLFVRDSRNVIHAERVWLDGERSDLSGVHDVQSGIDRLRDGTVLHTVIHPGMSAAAIHAALKNLRGQARTLISFEPGEYRLERPLVLSEAGHVEVRGHRALLGHSGADRVLVIRACDSLVLEGLTLVGEASRGKGREALRESLSLLGLDDKDSDDDPGWGGALSVIDTPHVRLLDVRASVASDDDSTAAGILVQDLVNVKAQRNEARMHVDIGHCGIDVGAQQAGIVCLQAARAYLHDNVVRPADPDKPLRHGLLAAGTALGEVRIERNRVEGCVIGCVVGVAASLPVPALPKGFDATAHRVSIAHNDIRLNPLGADRLGCLGVGVNNADRIRVVDNEIRLTPLEAVDVPLQGVRLQGELGSQVMVQDNTLVGLELGIVVQPGGAPQARKGLWLISGNVGEQVGKLLDAQGPAQGRITQRDNIET
jgi:hypothetical protein